MTGSPWYLPSSLIVRIFGRGEGGGGEGRRVGWKDEMRRGHDIVCGDIAFLTAGFIVAYRTLSDIAIFPPHGVSRFPRFSFL